MAVNEPLIKQSNLVPVIQASNNDVTFKKDSTTNYNALTDNVSGRIYFKKDGIWVDNYLYSYVLPLTTDTTNNVSSSTTTWTTCYNLTPLVIGTYIIQVVYDSNYYSGIFSYSGVGGEEIPLHKAGSSESRIYLKTSTTNLQIASDTSLSEASLNIKIIKLL